MKDKVITVRLRTTTRTSVARVARLEGRSLSGQIERFIEQGLGSPSPARRAAPRRAKLGGLFRGGAAPTLDDFRAVRADLSAGLAGGRQRRP
jgi:hypothetical protein